MRATLTAVARLADVSTSTASRALRGDAKVSPTTRARVLQAAERLRYHPDGRASALRTQRTGLVGLCLPTASDPLWARFADRLADLADASGRHLFISLTCGRRDGERLSVRRIVEHRFDGVILASPPAGPGEDLGDAGAAAPPSVRALADAEIPAVVVGRASNDGRVDGVEVDRSEAVRLLVHALAASGHRRIGALLAPEGSDPAREQHLGLAAGLAETGLPLDPGLVRYPPDDVTVEALGDLIASGADSVVLGSARAPGSTLALGSAAVAAGITLAVADHVADDIAARWAPAGAAPSVLSLDDPAATLADAAWDLLGRRWAGEGGGGRLVRVAPTLVGGATVLP